MHVDSGFRKINVGTEKQVSVPIWDLPHWWGKRNVTTIGHQIDDASALTKDGVGEGKKEQWSEGI